MTSNMFASNLRAPVAHRIITSYPSHPNSNQWKLHSNLDSGESINPLLQGFHLSLVDNDMQDNGLSFDSDSILRMLSGTVGDDRKAKKSRVETGNQSVAEDEKFPDGNSLLKIEHFISRFDENSFPHKWESH